LSKSCRNLSKPALTLRFLRNFGKLTAKNTTKYRSWKFQKINNLIESYVKQNKTQTWIGFYTNRKYINCRKSQNVFQNLLGPSGAWFWIMVGPPGTPVGLTVTAIGIVTPGEL